MKENNKIRNEFLLFQNSLKINDFKWKFVDFQK